jgi:hypothetical protein
MVCSRSRSVSRPMPAVRSGVCRCRYSMRTLRLLDGRLRMRRSPAGEHVYRRFRLVGEQDVSEGVCPENGLGTRLILVEWIISCFVGHQITSLQRDSILSAPEKPPSASTQIGLRKYRGKLHHANLLAKLWLIWIDYTK